MLRICRECGYKQPHKEKWHRNICKPCKKEYDKRYKNTHKKIRKRNLEYAQKSPEDFIKHVYLRIRRNNPRYKKDNPRFIKEISKEYVIDLYYKQNGLCALSNIKMDWIFGSMKSISIDRINSNYGYVEGNIQLLCQAINLMKNKHSNQDAIKFIKELQISSNKSALVRNCPSEDKGVVTPRRRDEHVLE